MKGYLLTSQQVDDILLSKFVSESDDSIAERYSVTGKTVGNWLRSERFVDRRKEIVSGLRSTLGAKRVRIQDQEVEIAY